MRPIKSSLSIEQFLEKAPPQSEPELQLPYFAPDQRGLWRCGISFYRRWSDLRKACKPKKSMYSCECRKLPFLAQTANPEGL